MKPEQTTTQRLRSNALAALWMLAVVMLGTWFVMGVFSP